MLSPRPSLPPSLDGPPFWIFDSFVPSSCKLGTGNPAAVVYMGSADVDNTWMQMVAAEFNLSETAFVWDNPAPADGYIIRFFTPTIEMDLCGHATLAASAAAFLYFSPPDITSTSFHAPA